MIREVRLRPVALPAEHGGWSLLFEPIILGLLLAPSLTGLFISVAAAGVFLARHPFKLVVGDWRRRRRTGRTAIAERFTVLYSCFAMVGFIAAILSAERDFLLPLILAAPITAIQLFYDARGRSRSLTAELAGSISTGALAAAIVMGGGWTRPAALGLWVIIAGRAVPTILYLRARLRILRRKPASTWVVIGVHCAAMAIVGLLARFGLAPMLAVAVCVGLLARAAFGFLEKDTQITAKHLGFRELAFGGIAVISVAIGFRFGW